MSFIILWIWNYICIIIDDYDQTSKHGSSGNEKPTSHGSVVTFGKDRYSKLQYSVENELKELNKDLDKENYEILSNNNENTSDQVIQTFDQLSAVRKETSKMQNEYSQLKDYLKKLSGRCIRFSSQ